jgi:hypothetical protein
MQDFRGFELGHTGVLVPLESADEHRLVTARMVEQCRRTVYIVSRDLDPAVYDVPEFCAPLMRALLESRRMKVRVLVHDAQTIVRHGHRLLDVAYKLSSFVDIRKPGPDHKDYSGGMFVADGKGYVTRRTSERYVGAANFNDPREATLLIEEFDEMWQKSSADPNLRRFRI